MKKLDIISYLRGFSIFTIVLMHLMMMIELPSFLGKAIMLGGAGVHVFFLCSGFGLYLSHLRKSLAFGPFIRKRLMKVYWPYVFVVLLWAAWITFESGVFPVLELSSHIFLWKMFSVKMDTSLCYPYWFVSTIIQFYLVWPILVRLIRCKYGLGISCAVSLSWTTAVGALGLDDVRPWGSFFLQYLWEFCLGMYLANKCYNWMKGSDGILPVWLNVQKMPWLLLIMGVSLGMGLNGVMTIKGGMA